MLYHPETRHVAGKIGFAASLGSGLQGLVPWWPLDKVWLVNTLMFADRSMPWLHGRSKKVRSWSDLVKVSLLRNVELGQIAYHS